MDKLDEENVAKLSKPVLVLCEGKRDAAFVRKLADHFRLAAIQVGFPVPDQTSDAYGKGGFQGYLLGLGARAGFAELRHLVILRDCNGSAAHAFDEVAGQVREAGGLAIPLHAFEPTAGQPSVTIALVPGPEEEGNLDTLLLRAIQLPEVLRGCLEAFWACARVEGDGIGKASKIKLTSILALAFRNNPSISLAFVWDKRENPIALDHACFQPLVELLRRISAV